MIKKIVIIGPESTGKSSLCKELAHHFNTLHVEEYARQYLIDNGMGYTYDDLLTIAKGQIGLEDNEVKKLTTDDRQQTTDSRPPINPQPPTPNSKLLFIDTDMYVMKVWCEFVFDKCHQWILDTIAERKYDFYLLCNIDLPWVKDELREYPDIESREKLYNYYKDALINQAVPWKEISGNYQERLNKAIKEITDLMQ